MFRILHTGELSFSSENMSCLGDVSPVLSPLLSSPNASDDESEGLRNSETDHRIQEEGSHSSLVVNAAMMAGSAVVMASQPRKKHRASGFHTPIFLKPVSFNMVSEFYGPEMFRKSFRMSRTTFGLLLDSVRDLVERRFVSGTDYRRATVPADIRLAITLRILAGASYCDLSLAYQVKESTVFDIFASTCDALNSRLYLEGFPKTKLALQHIAEGFQTSRTESSPVFGCVGALDGASKSRNQLPASFPRPSILVRDSMLFPFRLYVILITSSATVPRSAQAQPTTLLPMQYLDSKRTLMVGSWATGSTLSETRRILAQSS